jgi:glutaredoxin
LEQTQQRRGATLRARTSIGGGGGSSGVKLVLYTKPGCCLCDGLKETLDEVMARPTLAESLRSLTLETRDVSTNHAWAEAYALEVPVLTLVVTRNDAGGAADEEEEVGDEKSDEREDEIPLPRPAPRLSPARLCGADAQIEVS